MPGPRPSLPQDWPIRDLTPAEQGIKQVNYPEAVREREGGVGPAREARPPVQDRSTPPGPPAAVAVSTDPNAMPSFEIRAHSNDPLLAALRCYLEKRPADAADYLKGYDKANQDVLRTLLPLAAQLHERSLDKTKPSDLAAVAEQLHELELPLQSRAPLHVEKMCFCRLIKQFGCYEPLEENQAVFQAGSGGQPGELVQVYAEVRNFASQGQGAFQVTRLSSWAEIRDYEGHKITEIDFGDQPDLSRSPRQDYFINYSFRVPAGLPPGPYTLWIYVKDVLSQPARPPAQRSLDFRVIASGPVHGSRGEPGLAVR